MSRFHDFALAAPILNAVVREGYDTPTPVQALAIPPALEGRDVMACAQTGTGKTAAFALPLLHRLFTAERDTRRRGARSPRALILSPTRELAGQIEASLRVYGADTGLAHTVVVGGVSQFHQVRALRRGVDVLVATPGRLIDLLEQGEVDLSEVGVFVLDEADRMLDMGFIQPIRKIAGAVRADRQTMLFSATIPKAIVTLADALLRHPVRVRVEPERETTALIEQQVYMATKAEKHDLLAHLLCDPCVERAVVFTRTKHGADKLTKKLSQNGTTATAIHGNKAQRQRERALESFRDGRSRVLVATDVAARGLDIDGVTHVFNYDLPNEPETYVHRIGRTGRAGAAGVAVSFCDRDERGYLRAIEKLTGTRIPMRDRPGTPATPDDRRTAEPREGERATEPRAASPKKPKRTSGADEQPTPKRKPRRRGGPGWGVEQDGRSGGGDRRPASGKKKSRGARAGGKPGGKPGGKQGGRSGDSGKPGTGVKRVHRSEVSPR